MARPARGHGAAASPPRSVAPPPRAPPACTCAATPGDAAPQAKGPARPPWRGGSARPGPARDLSAAAAAEAPRPPGLPRTRRPPRWAGGLPPSPPRAPRTHGAAAGRPAGRQAGRQASAAAAGSVGGSWAAAKAAPLRPARPAPGLTAPLPAPASARTAPRGARGGRAAPGAVRAGREGAAGGEAAWRAGSGWRAKCVCRVGRAVGTLGCPRAPAGPERTWAPPYLGPRRGGRERQGWLRGALETPGEEGEGGAKGEGRRTRRLCRRVWALRRYSR